MIPLTLADDIRTTLLDYLTTTFNFQDEALEAALVQFLELEEGGLFKGPYVHLRLPFRKAPADARIPLEIAPPFQPYVHQLRAFERLTIQGGNVPLPTLVTTGTGSGKTECFLYPILDHCYSQRGRPGIKAIVLYPMNALASDQATRLAQQIHGDERLRGQVRAGIYIGGEGRGHSAMGADHLVEDRAALRREPPDILLTNYKMLDFLLLRPEDRALWRHNGPETLRYLVLDELHTYDGAQGSDVACLLRRVQARLGTPPGYLCPVGTSATVLSDSGDTVQALTSFARQVFDQAFDPDAVIGEERLGLADFLLEPDAGAAARNLPADAAALAEQSGESYEDYVARQSTLWLGAALDPIALGQALRHHPFLAGLLACTRDSLLPLDELLARLARWDPDLAAQPAPTQRLLLQSFLALIAHARSQETDQSLPAPSLPAPSLPAPSLPAPSLPAPLLTLQVQLWVREMSRLMRAVEEQPAFFWRDDAPIEAQRRGLPAYFCRECGHSGWLALLYDGDRQLTDDTRKIYNGYFERSHHLRYIYPGSRPGELPDTGERLCPRCLLVDHQPLCPVCAGPTFAVVLFSEASTPQGARHPQDLQCCPQCGTDDALSIVGSQAATLSSVAISHLYTSPLNSDKKLLAFTDSVQDASHRAAFFGARTFRFSLRTAMQAVLADGQPVRLSDFAERMLAHWQGVWSGPAGGQKLAAAFMPPDLRELPAYRRYVEGSPQPMPPTLWSDLRQRLSWEVAMEYGFNARLGRSLEKAGSSTALPDRDLLAAAVQRLSLRLPEEIGLLRGAASAPDAVQHFLLGLLERTRVRGGVHHPLLARFVESQGNWFLLLKRQQPLLSPFHKRSRFPRFLTDQPQRDVFDAVISRAGRQTWYTDWAQRALDPALGVADVNEVYRLALDALLHAGLLRDYPAGASYGLRPEALLVTRRTAGVQCRVCGHKHTVAVSDQTAWLEQPCLAYQCPGVYEADADFGQRYYRDIYERGHVERIFSYEHTGLLSRQQREAVERQFKLQDRADAANLLTATPTLELGIDIGDLSATMACAVPPTTANYLQRIGRAGRKTGNSLILALANAQPHDLYFFEQPLEMIAGAIAPPGCFLDAPNMLARQFLAFCMDSWTATMPVVKPLPRSVKDMLAGVKRGAFPADFLAYFDAAKGERIDAFLALFGAVVSPDNQGQLRALAAGDELPARVRAALAVVEAERASLQADRRTLRQRLEAIQADPSQYQEPQAEMKRLQQEMRVLQDLLDAIDRQYPLNFFTDAGLLPNYAFPETGVKLQVVITGLGEEKEGGKGYLVKDYLRAAPLALRELAPFNTFYAEGRKLPISFVETPGRAEAVERWQFCDRCSHLELVQASHYSSACPSCGSPHWIDLGQQHDMVAFRQAGAWVDHHESLVGDDADERERHAYQIGRHFEMRPEHSDGAFVLPSLPFGIEHLNQVTLREVNFGAEPVMGARVTIADEERPLQGFRVCQGCGLVVAGPTGGDAAPRPGHKRTCPYQSGNGLWRDIYLYRQMSSEALRILLPVSTVLIAEKLATFEACLDLGLRRRFGGNPDHLQIVQHQEPAADGAKRRYLVIFDTVPGGTSFLRDLARPEEFRQVLQLALDALTSCRCRSNPQKAACYRCLYSHRSQRDLALISRERGIEMLQEILGCWGELAPLASLSDAHMDSLVESELEQRFVDALAGYAGRMADSTWTPRLHNGRLAWELGLGQRRWLVEAQVKLGPEQGVAVTSRADFVLWPLGAASSQALPVAVFTDGFAYHVRPRDGQGRIGDDLLKRRAIRASGRFVVWSVTWDDVEQFGGDGQPPASFLHDQASTVAQLVRQRRLSLSGRLLSQDAVTQLLEYLRAPEPGAWQDLAGLVGLAALSPPRPPVQAETVQAAMQRLRSEVELPSLDIPGDAPPGDHRYSVVERYGWPLHLLVTAAEAGLRGGPLAAALSLTLRLEDGPEQRSSEGFVKHWRQYWLLDNLLQFLPDYAAVSNEYIGQFVAQPDVPAQQPAAPVAFPGDPAWNEALRFADPSCASLLQACQAADLPAPTVGFELLSAASIVVAQAELAWPEQRVAVLLPGEEESRAFFAGAGWQVFDVQQGDDVLATLTA